jgi:sigma-E factor negative regulatory protein RseA
VVNDMKSEISAFMDGELAGAELEPVLGALREDGEAVAAWRVYHLIGDALHGPAAPGGHCISRIRARLEKEPALIGTLPADIVAAQRPRWFVPSAIAASLSAIALVGWMVFAPRPAGVEVARAPAPTLVQPLVIEAAKPTARPTPVRHPLSPSARDYLLAHQVYSPRNSLQGVAPYIRSVSAEAAGTP